MRRSATKMAYSVLGLLLLVGTAVVAANCSSNAPGAVDRSALVAGVAENFNDVPAGAMPVGWTADTSGGSVGVDELPDRVDKSLRIAKPKPEENALAARQFDPPLTGVIHVEARVRFSQTAGWIDALYLADGAGSPIVSVAVRNGQFSDVGTNRNLLPAAAARWYALRATIRADTSRFDLFIDGAKILADAPFRTPGNSVGRLTFGIGTGNIGVVNVDTVSVRRIPPPTVSYVVSDLFDDGTVDAAPAGYELTTTGGTAAVSGTPSAADKSLRLAKTAPAGQAKAVRAFPPQTGTILIQATIRTDEIPGVKAALYVQNAEGQTAVAIQFSGGALRYATDASTHVLVNGIQPGEWYTVKLVLDMGAQRFAAFVDGRRYPPVGTSERPARLPFRSQGITDISRLVFNIDNGQTGSLYADKVMVYRNPAPGPVGTVEDVRAHGAKGDGIADDTAAIQAAIKAVPFGGSVYLGGGVFRSGTIALKSDMTLYVDHDATLLGTQDDAGYPDLRSRQDPPPAIGGNVARALIFSHRASRVVIEGGGVIHGNGDKPAWTWRDGNTPHESTRPAALFLTAGTDVTVRNIHVKDAGTWAVVPAEIERLTIADVEVDSTVVGHRDGIDIVDSRDVLLERVSVMSDDDAICFKSHRRPAPGSASQGVDGATVRLSTVGGSVRASGIKFGTASSGAFRNVIVEDVLVKHTNNAAIAIANVDGAVVSNVAFRRITIVSTKRAIFVLIGRRILADDNGVKQSVEPKWISALRFEDITGTHISDELPRVHLGNGVAISGTTEPTGAKYKIYDVLVSNVSLSLANGGTARPNEPAEYEGNYPEATLWTTLPAYGFYFRHVDGLTVRSSKVTVPDPHGRNETAMRSVTDSQIS